MVRGAAKRLLRIGSVSDLISAFGRQQRNCEGLMTNMIVRVGTTLKGASLSSPADVKRAFEQAFAEGRYERYLFNNLTQHFAAKLVLFQGLSTLDAGQCGPLPPGYVTDTGVTVGGINVGPQQAHTTTIQQGINCLATVVKAHAQLVHLPSGREFTYPLPDTVMPPGKPPCTYFEGAGHTISERAIDSQDPFEALVAIRMTEHLFARPDLAKKPG